MTDDRDPRPTMDALPREVACPRCHGALRREGDVVECTSCHARFAEIAPAGAPLGSEVIDFLSQPEQKADRERRR